MMVLMTDEQLEALLTKVLQNFKGEPTPAQIEEANLLTPEELCKRLNISIPTQIRYRKKGKLPWIQIGNAIRYNWQDVLKALGK